MVLGTFEQLSFYQRNTLQITPNHSAAHHVERLDATHRWISSRTSAHLAGRSQMLRSTLAFSSASWAAFHTLACEQC